jgi:hypothetical protein
MIRAKFCVLALGIFLLVLGLPQSRSDYEMDSCIEGCSDYIDQDKDPIGYSQCVEDCKRQHQPDDED